MREGLPPDTVLQFFSLGSLVYMFFITLLFILGFLSFISYQNMFDLSETFQSDKKKEICNEVNTF